MKIKAIYCEEILIGFAMYGIDSDDGNYWIYRFMIDEQFQGRGHGKGAMKLIIEDIRVGMIALMSSCSGISQTMSKQENYTPVWVLKSLEWHLGEKC